MTVLFVCNKNTGRSQIAAALYNKYAVNGRADSAGTDVGSEGTMRERAAIAPAAQRVIDDMKVVEGIDISDSPRTQLNEAMLADYDSIVVIADAETLPKYMKNHIYIHWDIADPVSQSDEEHTKTIETIKNQVMNMLEYNN